MEQTPVVDFLKKGCKKVDLELIFFLAPGVRGKGSEYYNEPVFEDLQHRRHRFPIGWHWQRKRHVEVVPSLFLVPEQKREKSPISFIEITFVKRVKKISKLAKMPKMEALIVQKLFLYI